VEKGTYDNFRIGTVLKDIEMEIVPGIPRVRLDHGRASDGETGKISMNGWLDILPSQDFPFELEILMDQAKLLRHDDAMATAAGQLTLSGSLVGALLAGEIGVGPAEIRIPERLPPEMTDIEVIETPLSGAEPKAPQTAPPPRNRQLKLDVSVVSPGQVFVRGRGLDSEWRGNLRVKGRSGEPVVTGRLSMVRGHFNFLGKRFNLSRGLISFNGAVPPAPQIDVLAKAGAKEMTALLQLTGPLRAPMLKLSSEPFFPSDEILSRLLFGRSVTTITPYQAVQLAHALNAMSGGRGLDLTGRTRRFLGVDQLDIRQSGENIEETTLSAGKYVNDKVYIQVDKGIDAEQDSALVEWEVTPNISVETEVGVNAQGGVGLKWKWDY
jgi:translocation and assembly module TamB